jgi:hypothetical protein
VAIWANEIRLTMPLAKTPAIGTARSGVRFADSAVGSAVYFVSAASTNLRCLA